jgi:hypothetical protein
LPLLECFLFRVVVWRRRRKVVKLISLAQVKRPYEILVVIRDETNVSIKVGYSSGFSIDSKKALSGFYDLR